MMREQKTIDNNIGLYFLNAAVLVERHGFMGSASRNLKTCSSYNPTRDQ